jgi:hypothetical protein
MIVFRDELKNIHINAICYDNRAATESTKVHGAIVGEKATNDILL